MIATKQFGFKTVKIDPVTHAALVKRCRVEGKKIGVMVDDAVRLFVGLPARCADESCDSPEDARLNNAPGSLAICDPP